MIKQELGGEIFWSIALVAGIVFGALVMRNRGYSTTATYYNNGSITASGEEFDPRALTCAHPSAGFGSWILVKSKGKTPEMAVCVRVNDRCKDGIDLTPEAFARLAPLACGRIDVLVKKIHE